MAENVNENQEVNQVEQSQEPQEGKVQEREYSDVEKRAMDQGWRPQEEWDGDPEDWKSAKVFVRDGELYAKIDELHRRDKSKEATLYEMKKHIRRVRETEYARALNHLKNEKAQALEDGDARRVVEIDDQIANTKVAAANEIAHIEQPSPMPDAPTPQFVAWINRNTWYQNDVVMKAAADAIGDTLVRSGERNPTKILEEVEKRVRKEFPNRFTNPNRSKPGAVESGGARGTSGSGGSFQLTPEETQVMKKFVKAGLMTEKEYIADIKAERGA